MKRNWFLWVICLVQIPWANGIAQTLELPLNQQYTRFAAQQQAEEKPLSFHSNIQPYSLNVSEWRKLQAEEDSTFKRKQYSSWLFRKTFNENLIRIDTMGLMLRIDPVVHFEMGRDQEETIQTNYYKNTRGFRLEGSLGKRISFYTAFFENQAIFPQWVDSAIVATRVAPGSGRVKIFEIDGFDYSQSSSALTIKAFEWLHVRGGHGKHFFGDGYRSLLLSDNSFNYPFLQTDLSFFNDRLRILNTWASLQSIDRVPRVSTPEGPFQRKAATFNYVSWNATSWLNLGLFEAVIWQRWDSTGTQPYNWAIANPVVLSNSAIQGMNAENNAVLGLSARATLAKKVDFYGQYVIDQSEETGFQLGVKSFGLLKGLFLRAEYNEVEKGAFDHRIVLQNYGHFNQALGHTLGGGFQESVLQFRYRWRSWFVDAKWVHANYGQETDSIASGRNIFRNEEFVDRSEVGQDVTLDVIDLQWGYVINPRTNAQCFIGITNRVEQGEQFTNRTRYVYLALRTSLTQTYYDF